MDALKWLQQWYKENCNGDWEHTYGVEIGTLDNPGWYVNIDLTDTNLEDVVFEKTSIKRSENDWIYCCVKNNVYEAACGPLNLSEIIEIFKDLSNRKK